MTTISKSSISAQSSKSESLASHQPLQPETEEAQQLAQTPASAEPTEPSGSIKSPQPPEPLASQQPNAQQPYIQISGLSKHYGQGGARLTVLNGVATTVNAGEICVLLGPSGSGKSTFLNIVGGLEEADSGEVVIGGRDIAKLSQKQVGEYRRQELGFVFQFYNLVQDLTIRENIEVGAYLSENALPLEKLLSDLGLAEHADKFPNQVSGGQQQRCAIGRALAKNPRLLLCDEPTGALDYKTSKEILELMEQVNRDYGCTIIIVTHNDAIARMAHRVLRLRDGKLVQDAVNSERISAAELTW